MGFGRLRAGRKVTVNGRTFVFIVRRIGRMIGLSVSRCEYEHERGRAVRGVFLESGGADVRFNGSNDTRTSCSAYLTRAFYFHAIKIYDACNEVRHHFYFDHVLEHQTFVWYS